MSEIRESDVIIAEQPRTAVYLNPHGQVVVRQDQGYDEAFVFFSAEHLQTLIRALTKIAPHAGFRQLEDDDDDEPPPAPPCAVAHPWRTPGAPDGAPLDLLCGSST